MKTFFGYWLSNSCLTTVANRNSAILNTFIFGIACVGFSTSSHSEIQLSYSNCPHIVVLEKKDFDQVSFWVEGGAIYHLEKVGMDVGEIHDPRSKQLAHLPVALEYFTPFLCQAVRRIVFVKLPNSPGVSGWNASNDRQDLIYLNTIGTSSWNNDNLNATSVSRVKAIKDLVHESAHAAIRLLQSRQKSYPIQPKGIFKIQWRPNPDLWGTTAGDMAKDVIQRLRLEKGVLREWLRLHNSFQAFGYAGEYYRDNWQQTSTAALNHVKNGFTSAYGGKNPMEDIAELTGWAITGDLFTGRLETELKDEACTTLSDQVKTGVPGRFAAVYTKLTFLKNMGLIDAGSYDKCVGRVGLVIDGPGFHRVAGGQEGKTYRNNLTGKLGSDEYTGNHVFVVEAEGPVEFGGESFTGVFSLKLSVADGGDDIDLVSWPRGIYSLSGDSDILFGDGKTVPGANQFWLRVKDKPAGTLVSIQGLALVVNGSEDLIEGSIVLQKVLRPYAPMPVPQVVPGRLTFQLKH